MYGCPENNDNYANIYPDPAYLWVVPLVLIQSKEIDLQTIIQSKQKILHLWLSVARYPCIFWIALELTIHEIQTVG